MANSPNPPASETQTPPVAPPPTAAPSLPPVMVTAGSFYLRSSRRPCVSRSGSSLSNTFRVPMINSASRFSHPGRDSGSNPCFRFGAKSSQAGNKNTHSGPGLRALSPAQSQGDGKPVEPVAEKEGETKRSLKGKAPVVESSDEDDSDDVSDGEVADDVAGDGVGAGDEDADGVRQGEGGGGGDGDGVGDEDANGVGQGEGGGVGGGVGDGDEDGNGGGGAEDEEKEEPPKWKLRQRKTVNRFFIDDYNGRVGGGGGSRSAPRPASRPRPAASKPRPAARRSRSRATPKKAAAVPPPPPPVAEKPKKKLEFSYTLTKEEIEHDFLLMTGALPPKKPQKRPKNVQKKLDEVSPGMYFIPPTREQFP